ncbi:hypothetical protein, partial [Schlesneria sp.]|uniref:hypothetical protein n=1 Tax=Schlesneria sp. TaxID=2762018 RepID=UPI002EDDC619
LVLWMVLLAMGDWLSTITHSEIAKTRLHLERRELEEQIRHYRATQANSASNKNDSTTQS